MRNWDFNVELAKYTTGPIKMALASNVSAIFILGGGLLLVTVSVFCVEGFSRYWSVQLY